MNTPILRLSVFAALLCCAAQASAAVIADERFFRFTGPLETRELRLNAGSIVIGAADSGWYDSMGFHVPSNDNYIVGGRASDQLIFNDFFAFDLTGLTSTVTDAVLVAGCSDPDCYLSPDPTETYTLFDYTGSIASLLAGGSGLVGIWADLGAGAVYGSRVVSAADAGTDVSIPFDAAGIAAINAARGGQFAVGGALTSLQGQVSVPEPATLALLGLGLAGLGLARRRKGVGRVSAA